MTTMSGEPVLHLAKRAVKTPESLKAGEVKRLAEWVILAFREKQREGARIDCVILNSDGLFETARKVIG